ncbi:hypothetical protein [Streptomyces roseochromogenus]|uniref:Uncharacterized protein n=1 Tax=Streptomyces roseochromogenus subsp. oscitans DS 12.976 TaxID=1352936 RepID=V6JG87_STRRC|nr:hypothetical protein [Streptomyces roseochromogenus]EST18922.1 hypothetical protein M878_44205 [Streptomyces roseochromogenus subsp. oscitans DS 12.976]
MTDENGATHQLLDEDSMRRLADIAPDPMRAHALVDQILAEVRDVEQRAV